MKNLITLITFLFSLSTLSGQSSFGLKVTSPTVSSKPTYKEFFNREAGTLHGLTYLSTRTSVALGASYHADFKPGWLTIDLMYRQRSVLYKLEQLPIRTRAQNLVQDDFKELTIPVLAGIKKNNFMVGLGPVFNFKLDSKYGIENVEGFTVNPRNLNTGCQFMIGYVLADRFHIDLKREIGFNQVGEDYKSMGKFINLRTLPKTTSISFSAYF